MNKDYQKINKPLVSVLMSVYNSESTVSKAIESVLHQTYTNFEFLIIDDGSTDNTYETVLIDLIKLKFLKTMKTLA